MSTFTRGLNSNKFHETIIFLWFSYGLSAGKTTIIPSPSGLRPTASLKVPWSCEPKTSMKTAPKLGAKSGSSCRVWPVQSWTWKLGRSVGTLYTYIHINLYILICIHVYTYIYIYVCMYKYCYIYIFFFSHIYIYISIYIYICIIYINICIYIV